VLLPHLWAGLLAFDENGRVVPDLAEKIEPNDTADIWTCTIQSGLAFASGEPVTAQSFIESWLGALDPESTAPMAEFMKDVKGYDAFVSGESSEIGFEAADDQTIVITLGAPNSSFPAALATFVWALVDVSAADATPPADIAGRGLGMWQLVSADDSTIVMEPNPASPAPASPSIARVIWTIVDGPDAATTALDAYRSDEVAIADVPGSMVADVTSDADLNAELVAIPTQASTMAIGMDFNQPPFDQPTVRRAIAQAIDRDAWAHGIWRDEFVPAIGIVPPVVNLTSDYTPVEPVTLDVDAARSAIQTAGIDASDAATEVVYYQPAEDLAETIDRHNALLNMIQENAGVAIRHDTSLSREQIDALRGDNGGSQFDIVWWWTVTDTPALLDSIGRSSSDLMTGVFNWSPDLEGDTLKDAASASAAYNAALDKAKGLTDQDSRNATYHDAEQLLIDHTVYVPLGHWVQRYVQKSWLKGTRQGAWSGSIPVRFDADVTIDRG